MIIERSDTGELEKRKVNMVLSNKSCGIDEPFTDDIISKSEFTYQKKPKLKEKEKPIDDVIAERLAKDKLRNAANDEEDNQKEHVVEYRVRKGEWSYKTVKETVKGAAPTERVDP